MIEDFGTYIICISQDSQALATLFLSQNMRFIAFGYTFTVSVVLRAPIFCRYYAAIAGFSISVIRFGYAT